MASLGIRKFQDLVGRTDFLRVKKDLQLKEKSLDFSLILKSALDLRPGTNIRGGSVKQDFGLETRADNVLIAKSLGVINGTEKHVDIVSIINNEERAYTSTLSYTIARYLLRNDHACQTSTSKENVLFVFVFCKFLVNMETAYRMDEQ